MAHDPRVVVGILEDAGRVILRWTTEMESLAAEARASGTRALDTATETHRQARIAEQWANEAAQLARDLANAVDVVENDVRSAEAEAHSAVNEAQNAAREADQAARNWQAAYDTARAAYQRAVAAFNHARSEWEAALSNLGSARLSLDSALSALRTCQGRIVKDQNGRQVQPNCTGEQSAVSSAQNQVRHYEALEAQTQMQMQAAEAERNRREAEMNTCQSKLQAANTIAADAGTNAERSNDAVNSAQRSRVVIEDAKDASRTAIKMAAELTEFAETANQHAAILMQGASEMPQRAIRITDLSHQQTDLRARAQALLTELENRLRAFDNPGGVGL
ncbi:MAG: hypothetical protein AAGH53_02760 [Pseudomonadota bacterium]